MKIRNSHTDNRISCYRPDGTRYAILARAEWQRLRAHGKLEEHLKTRRESGEIISLAP